MTSLKTKGMSGWHAESSKQLAWEKTKKIELVLEKRSENSFRRWVPRARGVKYCSIKNDKQVVAGKRLAGWLRKPQARENRCRRNLSEKAKTNFGSWGAG